MRRAVGLIAAVMSEAPRLGLYRKRYEGDTLCGDLGQ